MHVDADSGVNYDDVRKTIAGMLDAPSYDDGSLGPVFIRLAWHASGTYDKRDGSGGSNGATMRFKPECDHGANAGLNVARDLLEKVKAQYPGISYADLWTLAGAVAVEEMGGPKIKWSPGRSDVASGDKCPSDGRLPDATQGAQHLRDIFYKMGFDDKEIVALSGAHCFGRCHPNRSGFDGPWTRAPTTFSNMFFKELLDNKWTPKKWSGPPQFEDASGKLMMLPADLSLIQDPVFRKHVESYAKDEKQFEKDFAKAFSKLMSLGVSSGKDCCDKTFPLLLAGFIGVAASTRLR
jgi:cytochrome c peroxidase